MHKKCSSQSTEKSHVNIHEIFRKNMKANENHFHE